MPQELEERLLALPRIEFLYAMSHNDLHAENVRVTGQDAILIDFASTDVGPLTADPAALDVSLVLNTTVVDDAEWEVLARSLYRFDALKNPPLPLSPEEAGSKVCDAVRFLR